MDMICDSLQSSLGQLYTCTEMDRYIRIRTPFLYPDGDVIDVYQSRTAEGTSLTDLGESLRWLRDQGLGQRRTTKQARLIDDIVLNHNVELFKGMLLVRVGEAEQLASPLTRLVQACVRVADLWFTFRTRTIEST